MIDPAAVAARLWPTPAALTVEASTGGGNNRLFRISAGGVLRALKFYPSADGRLRLRREQAALEWLRAEPDPAPVPAFHAADLDAPAALIDWIDGSPIGDPGERDIDAVISFTHRLLRRRHAVRDLPMAAEATPTSRDLESQIETRLARQRRPDAAAAANAVAQAYQRLGPIGGAPSAALIPNPSDFGFHNALRLGDGGLAFLDFEYFGQDDPVRLVGDFLLHPGMWAAGSDPASCPLRTRFVEGLAPAMHEIDSRFSERLERQLPYLALRWALIVLNPLAPERSPPSAATAAAQLAKSEALLAFALRFG
jgi:hypothetical protein